MIHDRENLMESAPIGFYQSTRDGHFLYANPEFIRMMGYDSLNDLKKYSMSDMYADPGDREHLIGIYDQGPDPSVKNVEVRFKKKNGKPICILLTSKAYWDTDGNTLSYDGYVVDISTQKNAEKKYKESRSAFKNTLQHLPAGFVEIGEDYRIHDVNKRTCEICGYTREELVGKLCDIICPKGSVSKRCPVWEEKVDQFTGMDTFIKCGLMVIL